MNLLVYSPGRRDRGARSDRLDFHDCEVLSIRAALRF